MPYFVLSILISVFLAGCANKAEEKKPVVPPTVEVHASEASAAAKQEEQAALRKLEEELAQGIKSYENGRYREAQQLLKNSLEGELIGKPEQVTANKYLAFITCANRQRDICKGYFRKALAINPQFELTPTEAGHPMWRTAFKEVRDETQKKKR